MWHDLFWIDQCGCCWSAFQLLGTHLIVCSTMSSLWSSFGQSTISLGLPSSYQKSCFLSQRTVTQCYSVREQQALPDLEKNKTEAQDWVLLFPSEYLIELASHQKLQTMVAFIPITGIPGKFQTVPQLIYMQLTLQVARHCVWLAGPSNSSCSKGANNRQVFRHIGLYTDCSRPTLSLL